MKLEITHIGNDKISYMDKVQSNLEFSLPYLEIVLLSEGRNIEFNKNEENKINTLDIFEYLKSLREDHNDIILGLVDVDIYTPGFKHIFGEAQLFNKIALVSSYRLKSNLDYSLLNYNKILFRRIIKEILHELGHIFKLKHCKNGCVMQFSETVKHIDEKSQFFCEECIDIIKQFL